MASFFRDLIERQIQKAMAEGKFKSLAGEGKPLADPPGDGISDAATQVAVRLMVEAGALPEEFTLKKQLDALREAYRAATTDAERRVVMTAISDLELRYNIAVEARRKFMAP